MAGEHRRRGLPLRVGVLDADHASGREQQGCPHLDHADRVEAVVAAPQREGGVVVTGLDGHRLPGLERDVRRVADDDVDRAGQVVERGAQVSEPQVDAGAGEVDRRVAVGAVVHLDRVHPRGGHLVGDGLGDGARAGAEVDDHWLVERTRLLDRPAGEQLGLGSRHEDARSHDQLDVAEVGLAGQVLQRLARGPPGDQGVVRLGLLVADVVDEHEPAAVGAEHVGQQGLGVGLRAGDAGLGQTAYGLGQQVAAPHVNHSWATAARRASRSASTAESMTGWRSPSSTASRL